MGKPTVHELVEAAEAIAKRYAERMPRAYAASVKKDAKHYDELPNEDDFIAWLEGYEWTKEEPK